MYLVEDKRPDTTSLVFTWRDPRSNGYQGNVTEGVTLDYDMDAVHSWPDGTPHPEVCVGRSLANPKSFKVFKYRSELPQETYEFVEGSPEVFASWKDYLKLCHPADLPDEDWYQELDRYDDAAVARRKMVRPPDEPKDTSRDEVAAWVAKKHLLVDVYVREVWYLPREAPADEIRLLELGDRLAGPDDSQVEAMDFPLDIEGAHFRLCVADITSEQIEQIKKNPSLLPSGWSLEGGTHWRRGA